MYNKIKFWLQKFTLNYSFENKFFENVWEFILKWNNLYKWNILVMFYFRPQFTSFSVSELMMQEIPSSISFNTNIFVKLAQYVP